MSEFYYEYGFTLAEAAFIRDVMEDEARRLLAMPEVDEDAVRRIESIVERFE